MMNKLRSKVLMLFWLFTTLLFILSIPFSALSSDASMFDPNKLSIVQENIKVLDGTWIADSIQEALTVVESFEDHKLHLCIIQRNEVGHYSIVSISSGILPLDDYYNNPHLLLDHMKDGHPYFDITTDKQWMYIELEKNDLGEWLVASLLIENLESGERLTCNCNVDTLSVWVYSIAYPRIKWPFLHDELILEDFDINSFAFECKRALSYIEEIKDRSYDYQALKIEW